MFCNSAYLIQVPVQNVVEDIMKNDASTQSRREHNSYKNRSAVFSLQIPQVGMATDDFPKL